ncbi:MAG: ribonuclease D, partial [Thermoleophilaceae bacterium]
MTLALAKQAATLKRVAIDTEFVSERRYQALLCLVQVAVPDPDAHDGALTEVLDPLADQPPDPGPLARVLADPGVEVV